MPLNYNQQSIDIRFKASTDDEARILLEKALANVIDQRRNDD